MWTAPVSTSEPGTPDVLVGDACAGRENTEDVSAEDAGFAGSAGPKFKVDDVYDMVTGGSADVAEPKEHPEVRELIIEQRASAESVELLHPLHYTTAPAD